MKKNIEIWSQKDLHSRNREPGILHQPIASFFPVAKSETEWACHLSKKEASITYDMKKNPEMPNVINSWTESRPYTLVMNLRRMSSSRKLSVNWPKALFESLSRCLERVEVLPDSTSRVISMWFKVKAKQSSNQQQATDEMEWVRMARSIGSIYLLFNDWSRSGSSTTIESVDWIGTNSFNHLPPSPSLLLPNAWSNK